MAIHNAADNSFKLIFDDHRLFSQFIRNFINIDILKEVKPEDIEDISERFIPLTRNSRDSDTVKRINLKGSESFFVIAILEHESQVNFRSSFKMLQYIYLVLDAWEKEVERENPGASTRKDFKYPPVLPIIFYDGKHPWTAEKNFFDKTFLNTAFEKYIPKFEYELVNLNDYNEEDIMKFGDALSFILLIDKVRDNRGKAVLTQLPPDYVEQLRLQIPENLSKLLVDVIFCLLDKSGFNRLEARRVAAMADKAGRKEYGGMFEAVIESIKEGQQEAWDKGLSRGREEAYQEKLRTAANFKKLGVSAEVIAQATGLSVEEIEGL
ncbi:MAG: Rpn family recombination-promoting nuclease/putative transposase [Treponema sp.]|nr:Rpn family recombination-promoting nuclease/putative transposase [Treponema sp.]